MLTPQNGGVPLDLSFRVGLGWMLDEPGDDSIRNAGIVAHQGGAALYHRSHLIMLPEHKLGVIVLANSASAGSVVTKVARETLKLALEAKTGTTQAARSKESSNDQKNRESKEQQMRDLEAKYGVTQSIRPQKTSDSAVTDKVAQKSGAKNTKQKEDRKSLTVAELQAYEGSYDTIAGLVEVKKKPDYLETELFDRTIRLTPSADGLLGMSSRFLGLFSVSLGELDHIQIDRETITGRDILKAVIDDNEYLAGERLKPVLISERWRNRTGEYGIVNTDNDTVLLENVQLRYQDGLLIMEYALPLFTERTTRVALTPLSDTEAVICGLGQGKGETVRIVNRNKDELLVYSGYLLRRKME